jgi:uncharacterized protein
VKWLGIFAITIAFFGPASASAVLDCGRAQSNVDKLLCSNPRLATADERMARAFRAAIHRGADPRILMETQRIWIQDVRDVCNDVECLLNAYEERISDLDNR